MIRNTVKSLFAIAWPPNTSSFMEYEKSYRVMRPKLQTQPHGHTARTGEYARKRGSQKKPEWNSPANKLHQDASQVPESESGSGPQIRDLS